MGRSPSRKYLTTINRARAHKKRHTGRRALSISLLFLSLLFLFPHPKTLRRRPELSYSHKTFQPVKPSLVQLRPRAFLPSLSLFFTFHHIRNSRRASPPTCPILHDLLYLTRFHLISISTGGASIMSRCLYSHFYPDHPRGSHTYANVARQARGIPVYLISPSHPFDSSTRKKIPRKRKRENFISLSLYRIAIPPDTRFPSSRRSAEVAMTN